jgi:hypothetical protein
MIDAKDWWLPLEPKITNDCGRKSQTKSSASIGVATF